jgi:RNA polymerase sigma-70 factor (TIGR02943 family)
VKGEDTKKLDPDNWVDAYGDALFGFALARVKKSEVAEDLVQETYFAALRSRRSFKGISSEKTWLFGILKHKVFDYFVSARKTLYLEDLVPIPDRIEIFLRRHSGGQIHPAHPGTDPEKDYCYREFLDHFYHCLANLPERTAQVFIYREIDGLSTEEICTMFGISKFNCWTILHRAKGPLRKHLELYGVKPLR